MDKITKVTIAIIVWLLFLFIIVLSLTDQAQAQAPFILSGGVIFWPVENGAIPRGWSEYKSARGRFLLGADTDSIDGVQGGSMTIDIQHNHKPGILATAAICFCISAIFAAVNLVGVNWGFPYNISILALSHPSLFDSFTKSA